MKKQRKKKISDVIIRTQYYWKRRKNKLRAILKICDGCENHCGKKIQKYKYEDNWGEIYKNYFRNVVTLQAHLQSAVTDSDAKMIFTPIITEYCEKLYLKSKIVRAYEKFIFI